MPRLSPPCFRVAPRFTGSFRFDACAIAVVGTALLVLAMSAAAQAREAASPDALATTQVRPLIDMVSVASIRGMAFRVKSQGVQVSLQPRTHVDVNQLVAVGSESGLDLALGDRAVFELGPGARFVFHQLGRAGTPRERTTGTRLERGYLRIVWQDGTRDAPIELSFARWAALLEPGEYLFDIRNDEASACAIKGTLRMSGVPEWTPRPVTDGCVRLKAGPPTEATLNPEDLEQVHARRVLLPVLELAARKQRREALARLETARTRGPDGDPDGSKDAAALPAGASQAVETPSPAAATPPGTLASSRNANGSLVPSPMDYMPRTLRAPIEATRAASTAALDSMARQMERQIAYATSEAADALVRSVEPPPEERVDPVAGDGASRTKPAVASNMTNAPAPTAPEAPPPLQTVTAGGNLEPAVTPLASTPSLAISAAPAQADRPTSGLRLVETATTPDRIASGDALTSTPAAAAPVSVAKADATVPSAIIGIGTRPGTTRPAVATAGDARPPAPDTSRPPAVETASASAAPTELAMAGSTTVQPVPSAEWIVNVATFPSLESAQAQADRLRQQNFATNIRRETVRGRSSYRVVVEGLATEVSAQSTLATLVSRHGMRQAWILRKY